MIQKDSNMDTRSRAKTVEKIETVEDIAEHVHERADYPLHMDQPASFEEDLVAAVPVGRNMPKGDPLA